MKIQKLIENIEKGLKVKRQEAEAIVYYNILPKKLAQRTLEFLVEHAKPVVKKAEEAKTEEKEEASKEE